MAGLLERLRGCVNGELVIRERELALPGLAAGLDGLRIAHVSDFHFWRWDGLIGRVREALEGLRFHLLAVTGDFCVPRRDAGRSAAMARRFFASVRAPLGAFAVLGNHDPADFPARVAGTPLEFLRNGCRVVSRGGAKLNVVGLDCAGNVRREQPGVAMAGCVPRALTVVLCHYPSTIRRLRGHGVALVLAGHTHGGQVRWPGIGCVWAHDSISRRYAWGLHRVRGCLLHVTAGVGVTGPIRARFNCPPEIAILVLRRGVGGAEVAPGRQVLR